MVHIITDSGAMLSIEELNSLKIDMVPLSVTLDGSNPQFEIIEVSSQEFLESVKTGARPASAAPAPGSFMKVFQQYPEDELIVITVAEFMSGSYNSACTARDMSEHPERISVIDSHSIAGPQRGLVLAAYKLAEAEKSREEIVNALEELRTEQLSFLAPSDISYLADGGRIPRSSVPVAKMLKAIPVLTIQDFEIKKYAIKLGFDAVMKTMLNGIKKAYPQTKLDLYIHYTDIPEIAEQFKAKLIDTFPQFNIDVRELSPVGIVHSGPNTLVFQALCCLDD